jgi:hypothetical protein
MSNNEIEKQISHKKKWFKIKKKLAFERMGTIFKKKQMMDNFELKG